jgi:hypothetical protein
MHYMTDGEPGISPTNIQASWEKQVEPVDGGTTVFAEGLGEVRHGEYLTIPKHQVLNAIGQPMFDTKGDPIWCKSTTGVVSIQKPLVGKPYVTVVCASNRRLRSTGQCNTSYKYNKLK